MQLRIDRGADVPIYRQIVDQIREQIDTGTLPPGTRLSPVRQVAGELGLTRLTVYSAYSELQAQGFIESHVGRGTFVASNISPAGSESRRAGEGVIADLLQASGRGDVISFAQAFPAPEAIPLLDLRRAFSAAMKGADVFDYGPIRGLLELRERVARLLLDRGLSVGADEVLITAGAQQAVDVVLSACTEPGDTIAVAAPTYPGVLELAALRHLNVIGIPSDDGGVQVDALAKACSERRPRLLYLIPTCSNPTGRTLARDRRPAILALAREHEMMVVEDDVYGMLSFDAPSPPALKRDDEEDVVLYIMSFSKMLAPALRLGALVAPMSLLPRLAVAKGSSDLVCSSILQRALAEYLRGAHLQVHLEGMRRLYRERCETMHAAIGRYLPGVTVSVPDGGLSMWMRLPDGVDEGDFVADALQAGTVVVPGRAFFPDAQRGAFVRLSFGIEPPERIERGIMALGYVLESHLRRRSPAISLTREAAGPLV